MPATDASRPARSGAYPSQPPLDPRQRPRSGTARRPATSRGRGGRRLMVLVLLALAVPAWAQDADAPGQAPAATANDDAARDDAAHDGAAGDGAAGEAEGGEEAAGEATEETTIRPALTEASIADAIARLTVLPAGAQAFDLLTGVTTLPDGGTIIDQETGLTLVADHIRYLEGEYIEAQGARAATEAGTLTATSLRIDVPSLTAYATEGVVFERPGLRFQAASAEYAFADSLVRFDRPTGENPLLEAEALLLAVDSGDALLLGPYSYQQGVFTLSDERDDAALQLRPVTAEDGTAGYRAANEVDPDLWARVAPLR